MTKEVTPDKIKDVLNFNLFITNTTILYKGGIRNYLLDGDIN